MRLATIREAADRWRGAALQAAESLCRGGARSEEHRRIVAFVLRGAACIAPEADRFSWRCLALQWQRRK